MALPTEEKWSEKTLKVSPALGDQSLLIDSVGGASKRYTLGSQLSSLPLTGLLLANSAITAADNPLSALGKLQGQINDLDAGQWEPVPTTTYLRPEAALGVTGIRLYNSGATQSVRNSYESNGFYFDSSDPTMIWRFWQGLQAETYIKLNNGAGALNASTGIQYYFNDANYRIGFDDTGGTGFFRVNVPTASHIYGARITAGALASVNTVWSVDGLGRMIVINTDDASFGGWVAGAFGGAATNRVVLGYTGGTATVAAYNNALSAFAPLNLRSDGQIMTATASEFNVVGLSSVFTSNAVGFSVRDASVVSKRTYLFHDATNNVGILESLQDSVSFRPTLINPNGTTAASGVAVGLTPGNSLKAFFHVENTAYFKNTLNIDLSGGEPSSPPQGIVAYALASGSFDRFYCKDHQGVVRGLGTTKFQTKTGTYIFTKSDDLLNCDASGAAVNIEIASTSIMDEALISKIDATGNAVNVTPTVGHFINGSGSTIQILVQWGILRLKPIDSTNMIVAVF